jgi:hypothetical protein
MIHYFVKGIGMVICFILFHYALLAQDTIKLKGRVFDKTTNLPLAYATVWIPNTGTGVVTNEFGEFTYHIHGYYSREKVEISYIGYRKLYLKVTSIKQDIIYAFAMDPELKNLKEIEIKGVKGTPALAIVARGIKNISINYPNKKFLLNAYYRDYIRDKNTNDYKNLTEAAIIIQDPGFIKDDYKYSKIKLEQVRYKPGITTDSILNFGYDGKRKYIPYAKIDKSNDLALLRLHDPIRNHDRKTFSFVNIFDHSFAYNHSFRYESIIYTDSSKIFEIAFDTYRILNDSAKTEYWVEGKIYILSGTYAILKFTYTVTCKLPSYSGKFFDLKIEYKNYQNKYYLNYLSLCNYFEFNTDTTSAAPYHPEQYFQYRELFVNKIVTKPFELMKRNEAIRKDMSLLSNKTPIQEGFWDNYNYISNIKLIE